VTHSFTAAETASSPEEVPLVLLELLELAEALLPELLEGLEVLPEPQPANRQTTIARAKVMLRIFFIAESSLSIL
jgi:hypothetical protein